MLTKDRLSAFVEALMRRYRVFAPVRRAEELRFEALSSADEAVLDYRNTLKAPKGILLPQTECLIRFQRPLDQFNAVDAVPLEAAPTVILGVRPCDARSFLMLDRVFCQGKYTDPYYKARREATWIISLACDHPRPTCFCHAFESGPYDSAGADILMREAGDAYLLQAVSDRGAQLLEGLNLPAADAAHLAQAEEIEAQARARLREVTPVKGIEEGLDHLFESKVWQEIAEKCIACGTCTYICPECHCFNIEDRVLLSRGERVRSWDACMYSTFTLHASGHNPRPDQASRWRQRVMHKFNYLPRNVGLYGCVGCGRCVLACPVRLDIRQVLQRVREACAAPDRV
jgi:sulfhydrogenase subunit beta (sulfur reductase)